MSQSTTIMNSQSPRHRQRRHCITRRRRGSTLLVVVALMGMLALLGLTFFAFASQELESAKNYEKAAELVNDPELGPDVYFDWALRQLSVGPGVLEKNSALFGGHMSLLPNSYGPDAHPNSGSRLRLSQTPTYTGSALTALSEPFMDLNRDGVPDLKDFDGDGNFNDLLWLNRSPSAHVIVPGGSNPNYALELPGNLFPDPDVDYTYPDINNAFLAHIAFVPYQEFDQNGNTVADPHEDLNGNGVIDATPYRIRVVKPSFWRPELLQRVEAVIGSGSINEDAIANGGNGDGIFDPRPTPTGDDANGNGVWDVDDFNGDGSADNIARLDPTWYWAPWAATRTLRPHPGHYYVPSDAAIPPVVRRYLDDSDPLDVPLIAGLPGGSKGFPFAGQRDATGVITNLTSLSAGAFSGQAPGAATTRFDVDADGDDIDEAILMDLDFPVQERPSDGALYIPLFAFTIYDGDGLINLNTAGNLSGDPSSPGPTGYFGNASASAPIPVPPSTVPPGPFMTLSQSKDGVSPSEVNPAWAMDADPGTTVLSGDYLTYFGRVPADRWELANMEQWWAKKGRVEFGGSLPELHAGLLGDTSRLWGALDASGHLSTSPGPPQPVIDLYLPGTASALGLAETLFPFAGNSSRDDNQDSNAGGKPYGNQGQALAFRHPVSFDGRGWTTTFLNPRQLDLFQIPGNPTRFQRYSQFGIAGDVALRNSGPGVDQNLMPAGPGISGTTLGNNFRRHTPGPDAIWGNGDDEYMLIDDMNEIVHEPRKASRPTEEIHRPAEAGVLHMSKTDIDNTGVTRRIQNLMPANINPNDASQEANERRRRFTVLSWDRKQFNLPRLLGPGADLQPGEAGVDDNRNGVIDDPGELGWPTKANGQPTDDLRAWEFSGDVDRDMLFEFPPANFTAGGAPVGPYAGYHPNSPFAGVNPAGTYAPDPFRPQLRRLLETEMGNRNEFKLQFRLNVNMLLDVVRSQNGAAHPYYSPLEYRPLTAHATDTGLTSITTVAFGDPVPAMPPQNNQDREFWARYDRQRMARDTYVMLYMLCGGNDTFDYRTNTAGSAYTDEQKRRMAQFAVNMVDNLDRDNVITMFEYDTDLSNGWGLDDQPWDSSDPDPTDRDVVFGVEAQELAFSETLWVYQKKYNGGATDNSATRYDETTQDHHHLFMELRNVAPNTVKMYADGVSTTHATAAWRIRRQDTNNVDNVVQATFNNTVATPANAVYFKSNGGNDVDPGSVLTIATADNDTGDNVSDLYVQYDPTDRQRLIAPFDPPIAPPVSGPLSPQCNLDLVSTVAGMTARFGLVNGTTTDEFLNDVTAPTGGAADRLTLVLERRLDPTQVQLPVTINPWITVDATVVRRQDFNLLDSDTTQTAIEAKLKTLTSRERREPLDARENNGTGGGDLRRSNSLKAESPSLASYDGTNDTGSNPFNIVQAHFDRDYVSSIELMTIPLTGPGYQTRASSRFNLSPYDQWLDTGLANDEGPFTAAAMFLLPSPPNQSGGGGPGTFPGQGVGPPKPPPGFTKRQRFKNHWHRMLEFVEVPTRTHLQLGGPFATTRIPGRINLNTLRHPEVLAALLDDPELYLPPDVSVDRFGLAGLGGNDSSRDWWYELLWSRDGLHPETLLTLPGMAYSKPFRGMGAMTDNASVAEPTVDQPVPGSPVEDSILRSHPDQSTPSPRGLFDIGTAADANEPDPAFSGAVINHHNRRRILSKILGNSTTRSNAFYVFIHVQFHEVLEHVDTNGNAHFRVGGRIDLNNDGNLDDGHRGFFVIDRSDAEEAYDSRTGTFDWKHLVKHRLTIN